MGYIKETVIERVTLLLLQVSEGLHSSELSIWQISHALKLKERGEVTQPTCNKHPSHIEWKCMLTELAENLGSCM